MSQRFLNGIASAKVQMAVSLLAEIQCLNVQYMLDLRTTDLDALQTAAAVLSDISSKLRGADHEDRWVCSHCGEQYNSEQEQCSVCGLDEVIYEGASCLNPKR